MSKNKTIIKSFISFFNFIVKKMSYTFAVALITSLGGFIIAGYIAIFLATTVDFTSSGSLDEFITLFSGLVIIFYAPGYFTHFGLLRKMKIPCFTQSLQIINKYIVKGKIRKIHTEKDLIGLYTAIEKLPKSNMWAAFIYPSIVMIAVSIQEFIIGSYVNAIFLLVGIGSAILLYILFTYIIAELLTGDYRRRLKRILVLKKISFYEKSYSSIKRKFVYISYIVIAAMVELGIMFTNQKMGVVNVLPWMYILLTAFLVGALLFFYLISIEDALLEIESAAIDLGRGGKGKLYGVSLDKEFIRTSKGIISAAYEVNEIRNNLQKKVEERTKELKETLDDVKKLKEQQDGDYFLTSLLTAPLNINKIDKSKNVSIDFIVKEKKTFEFKKWSKELGGDLCMAYPLELKGRNFTMFLNADAMGKSMQGAGGMLVMGSIMKFIIERTLDNFSQKSKLYPERWIRNAFVELQSVFETFDGTMLISMILGLVDNETGLMYFVNAEHPWAILNRNNKASFIENDLTFRKLGTKEVNKKFWVQTFQLRNNDEIFIGSDGKDDILLGYTDEKERIINEDENLILKYVEQNEGDIDKITHSIEKEGELTDDYSLLKIQYKIDRNLMRKKIHELKKNIAIGKQYLEDQNLIREFNNWHQSVKKVSEKIMLKKIIQILFLKKHYKITYKFSKIYTEFFPANTEMFYIRAKCAFELDKTQKAMEYSERFRARIHANFNNLFLLSKIHYKLKNYIRASKIIQEALDLKAKGKQADYLVSLFKKIMANEESWLTKN